MIMADYARMSTDALIDAFINDANHFGCPLIPGDVKMSPSTPEFLQAKDTLHAIAAELRARNPAEEIRTRLLTNESRAVRGWAAGQFLSSDPGWAYAAFCGVLHNLSTQDVVACRDSILNGPPPHPPLQKMTLAELVQLFVDACVRCYGTTRFLLDEEGGDDSMEAHNIAAAEIHSIAKEMSGRGKLEAFVPLLDHPLVTVKLKAAMYCLKIASEKAVAALEAVDASGERGEGVEAIVILASWREGKFDPFKL